MAASDGAEFFEIDTQVDAFARRLSDAEAVRDDDELVWAAVERLPSFRKINAALLRRTPSEIGRSVAEGGSVELLDVRRLDRSQRELLVKKALATSEQDNFKLLSGIKERLSRVGLELPKIEVRFRGLNVTADAQTGRRALPTLLNYTRDAVEALLTSVKLYRLREHQLTILNNIDGQIKPGRMTLLLGPPGSGKSTLLLALSGLLDTRLKSAGNITYNGHNLDEFCVKRTSAYISQIDSHIAELTVRETLDFAGRCQGASETFAGFSDQLLSLEKERKIRPSPEIDAFMKASGVKGKKNHVSTDYVLRVLGIDICSDTIVGNDMMRGVSGGQRKRVTTGEMIVGPRKTLFMDEISTGLDSSTTFQIVKCIRNFVHQMEATVLMALLQPAPETFELFDDLILLSEGHMVYHGPRADVLEFFESLGFKLPARKGIADFLQEVTSKKDQAQYWADPSKPYRFISVLEIAEAFKNSRFGLTLEDELSTPFGKSKSHPSALAKTMYAVPRWELFKACLQREVMLARKHSFLYIFRTCQVALVGFVAATTFIRSRLHPTDEENGRVYLACLFYAIIHMFFNGISELPITTFRLPVFYKQRDTCFYPAWAWSFSSWLLRVPYSVLEAVVWTCVVYYSVGLAPSPGRFFRYMFLLFLVHQMALGFFRMLAVVTRNITIANTVSNTLLMVLFCFGGFLVPKNLIKPWWIWGYWASPLTYAQRALSVNEFTAHRWQKLFTSTNATLGDSVLREHALVTDKNWYWYGAAVLVLYSVLFNNIITLALTYLGPLKSRAAIIEEATDDTDGSSPADGIEPERESQATIGRKGMILPFQPLNMTFHNVNYFVDMPKEMKEQGVPEDRLQLLSDVSGAFSPGVLTALVGSSGAGKTTLMDVLAGRKTGGYIDGDIRISGHPKVQTTFARVAGYVEQNDIHSPAVTVHESLWFSAVLRLPNELSIETKNEFVEQVMKLVELDGLKHAIVGLPGVYGLSTEQRKRLTIGVELVANPSIIFMDEPTSGLDARAAAIVMRAVRNTVDTGRTVVCTIHQPSIDIFESFDELILMKRGGRIIYGGSLGVHSQALIDYFQRFNGIPPIPAGYNPATWMLEVTTPSFEEKIGQDFAELYKNSGEFRELEEKIKNMSVPEPGVEPLHFDNTFAQGAFSQFKICLKKQFLVYWRSPEYNVVRLLLTTIIALILGTAFWDAGGKRDTIPHLFSLMGALYAACNFLGVSNATSVQPIVSVERTVFYREKAAGMYTPIAYAAAQGVVEIPYVVAQTLIYSIITYSMMNFDWTARKFLEYMMFMFLSFMYYTFYGMTAVGLTSSQHMAAVTSSAFYSLWNLFSGFLIPVRHIPPWWLWFYYICPVAWTLQGLISSQLADIETTLNSDDFHGTVKSYLSLQYGYRSDMIGVAALVLLSFNVLFFGIFMASARFLNFQKR